MGQLKEKGITAASSKEDIEGEGWEDVEDSEDDEEEDVAMAE